MDKQNKKDQPDEIKNGKIILKASTLVFSGKCFIPKKGESN